MAEEITVQPEQATASEPQTEPQVQNQLLKYVLFGLLGLLLLGGTAYTGYWYGARSAKRKVESEKLQPKAQKPTLFLTPTSIPTIELALSPILTSPIKDEAKNWEGYTNPKYAYSISYPSNARTKITDEQIRIYLGKEGALAGSYPTVRVEVASNPKGLSEVNFLAEKIGGNMDENLKYFYSTASSVNRIDAQRVVLDGCWWQGTGAETVYLIPRGSIIYLIWTDQYYGCWETLETGEIGDNFNLKRGVLFNEIDQILSTFRFLD